jgi:hypothetical protein
VGDQPAAGRGSRGAVPPGGPGSSRPAWREAPNSGAGTRNPSGGRTMLQSRLLTTRLVNPAALPCVEQWVWLTRRFSRGRCCLGWPLCCAHQTETAV